MLNENTLQVRAIKQGTVIDHIPEKIGFILLTLFHLTKTEHAITIGLNLPSQTLGKKDIIKIENIFLPDEQINQLALYAPRATINYIDNYHVVNKITPELPSIICGVLICPNSHCISRVEPIKTCFKIKKHYEEEIQLCCEFCEKSFSRSVILRV